MQPALRIAAVLGALSVVAWGAGWGVNAILEPQLASAEAPSALDVQVVAVADVGDSSAPVSVRSRRAPSKSNLVDPIVQRSIFDSSKVGAAQTREVESGDVAVTDLNLVLVSTLVVEPSEYSSAWIGTPGSPSRTPARKRGKRRRLRNSSASSSSRAVDNAYGYGIGDTIVGQDAEIVAIEQGSVTLKRGNGQLELLTMDSEAEAKAPNAEGSGSEDESDDDGVEKVGQDHYTISRDVIDKLAQDPSQLAKLGRAVPHKGADGNVDGYRLSGIRRKSVGRQLGLRSGDVVHSINGYEMTSMSSAMNAWNSLQDASSLDVEITRRGSKKGIKVDVE